MSAPSVTQMCKGLFNMSERTANDLNRIYGVSVKWLLEGVEPMMQPLNRDDDIASFAGSLLRIEDDNFKRRFISALSRLDETEWKMIEKFVDKLKNE